MQQPRFPEKPSHDTEGQGAQVDAARVFQRAARAMLVGALLQGVGEDVSRVSHELNHPTSVSVAADAFGAREAASQRSREVFTAPPLPPLIVDAIQQAAKEDPAHFEWLARAEAELAWLVRHVYWELYRHLDRKPSVPELAAGISWSAHLMLRGYSLEESIAIFAEDLREQRLSQEDLFSLIYLMRATILVRSLEALETALAQLTQETTNLLEWRMIARFSPPSLRALLEGMAQADAREMRYPTAQEPFYTPDAVDRLASEVPEQVRERFMQEARAAYEQIRAEAGGAPTLLALLHTIARRIGIAHSDERADPQQLIQEIVVTLSRER